MRTVVSGRRSRRASFKLRASLPLSVPQQVREVVVVVVVVVGAFDNMLSRADRSIAR